MNKITALPVTRNATYGFWTHPCFDELCGDREGVTTAEFNEWVDANGLQSSMSFLECSDDEEARAEYESGEGSFTKWSPERPDGDGWFVGSIHDTEDGPVCIWFRHVEGGAA
ncbi:hypothetical protein R8O49_005507 [Raoultella planticola]|uniref:hypothetical protein n=1 Tax=Klebsiella/Raoultella group TaxID=2890311 RepID=UPI0029604BC5|nr:hypothetical protein [Raoultella planticola]MBZ6928686.1 hypothetical protein [Klebsiella pneumoniae]HBQ2364708.1 hypothetical protein [Klebsiella pneumoniae]